MAWREAFLRYTTPPTIRRQFKYAEIGFALLNGQPDRSITQSVNGVVQNPFGWLASGSLKRELDLHAPCWRQFVDLDANRFTVR